MENRRKGILYLAILLFSWPSFVSAETAIRIACSGALNAAIPMFLGEQKKIFAKEGLTVEVIGTQSEQIAMQALVSGGVQYVCSSAAGFFYLAKQGGDVVGVASWDNSSPYSLATREKMKDLKELKGMRLATSGAGGRADAFTRFILAKMGLDPRKDAQIMAISGGSGIRLAALVSARIDGTLIAPTQSKHAEKLGLTVIPVPMDYIQGIILTRRSYLDKNRDSVKAFLRGLAESVRALLADKETSSKLMSRVLKIRDAEALDDAYRILSSEAVPDLFPTEDGINNVLKTLSYGDPSFAKFSPAKYFDLSVIEELKAERGQR